MTFGSRKPAGNDAFETTDEDAPNRSDLECKQIYTETTVAPLPSTYIINRSIIVDYPVNFYTLCIFTAVFQVP